MFPAIFRAFSKRPQRNHDDEVVTRHLSVWHQLPTELWLKVFAFLDKSDIGSLSCTSRAMRSISVPHLFASLRLRVGYNILDNHSKEKENEHVALAKKSIATFRRLAERKPMVGVSYTPNELVRDLCIVSGVDIKSKHIGECSQSLLHVVDIHTNERNPVACDVETLESSQSCLGRRNFPLGGRWRSSSFLRFAGYSADHKVRELADKQAHQTDPA